MRRRRSRYAAGVVVLQLLLLGACDVTAAMTAATVVVAVAAAAATDVMLLLLLMRLVVIVIHSASLSAWKHERNEFQLWFTLFAVYLGTYWKLPTICLWYSGSSCGGRAMSRWLSVGGDAGLGVLTNSSSSSSIS